MIEPLNRRSEERVASFVTLSQLGGLIVGLLLAFSLNAVLGLTGIASAVVMLALMVTGVILSVRYEGMALYEQSLWRMRAMLAARMRPRGITLDDLPGSAAQLHLIVRNRDGLVNIVPTPPRSIRNG